MKMTTIKTKTVKWLDSWSDMGKDGDFYTLESVKGLGGYIRYTCGFEILNDEYGVVLAMDFLPQYNKFKKIIYIPKISIVED